MRQISVLNIDQLHNNRFNGDFYASTLTDHLKENHARIEKPHRHNFYALFLFTQGAGIHEIDFNTYQVKKGSVFLLKPGQTHSWELSEDTEGYVFFHTQEFIDLYYVREYLREYPIFKTSFYGNCIETPWGLYEQVLNHFKIIVTQCNEELWKRDAYIASALIQLYVLLNRHVLESGGEVNRHAGAYGVLFQELEDLVDLKYKDNKSASFYSAKMGITSKHLNRICMELVGKTTSAVILDRVILEAKRMLLYTNKSFGAISVDLGYDDYSYFSRVFKKVVGQTPKGFVSQYK